MAGFVKIPMFARFQILTACAQLKIPVSIVAVETPETVSAATRRFLTESRAKVWRNAHALDRARRAGDAEYAATLAELERLCAARLRDLAAPGQVLLRLARRGFGVLLPGA